MQVVDKVKLDELEEEVVSVITRDGNMNKEARRGSCQQVWKKKKTRLTWMQEERKVVNMDAGKEKSG